VDNKEGGGTKRHQKRTEVRLNLRRGAKKLRGDTRRKDPKTKSYKKTKIGGRGKLDLGGG